MMVFSAKVMLGWGLRGWKVKCRGIYRTFPGESVVRGQAWVSGRARDSLGYLFGWTVILGL